MTILTRNTDILRAEVSAHIAADSLVRSFGSYWKPGENDVGGKGCFIGCLTHHSRPEFAYERFGLPVALLRIAENIFEALPAQEGKAFFAALPDAVDRDGKDLSRVVWAFLAAELRALPPTTDAVQAAIDPVILGMDMLANGQEWTTAADAGAAAYAAYAADAARAAGAAADYAAHAGARLRQRDTLLALIAAA
jgi:hypothetical protein